jgi:dihydrofolate reductase
MRKIIASTMVSADAVMENPQNWSFDYMNDEVMSYVSAQLFAADALIMGRVTYEGFAEAWSARAGADAFADRINALPKYVASRTLKAPLTWNANLLKSDIAAEVAQLKRQLGQDILQYGVGELTRTLLEHGLVDELRFIVFPVVVGEGERFLEKVDKLGLKLLEAKTFNTGVVALHYQPVNKA